MKKLSKFGLGMAIGLSWFVVIIFAGIIAMIILIDTFKLQLEKYIPGIKFILDNLYETLKDFSLFIKDLLIK